MNRITASFLAGTLLGVAAPTFAAPPMVPVQARGALPNPAAIDGLLAKLFPALPDPDPARLALARQSVALMWPDGAYEKMMSGMMDTVMSQLMNLRRSDLPVGAANGKAKPAASTADLTIHDAAAAKDPYFDQRMAAIQKVVHEQMHDVSAIVDPRMREGLSRAMARRFDVVQLRDINAFFATPTGRAFASQYMQLWMDPDTFRSMATSLPAMFKLMPVMSEKLKAATANIPKAPGIKQ